MRRHNRWRGAVSSAERDAGLMKSPAIFWGQAGFFVLQSRTFFEPGFPWTYKKNVSIRGVAAGQKPSGAPNEASGGCPRAGIVLVSGSLFIPSRGFGTSPIENRSLLLLFDEERG